MIKCYGPLRNCVDVGHLKYEELMTDKEVPKRPKIQLKNQIKLPFWIFSVFGIFCTLKSHHIIHGFTEVKITLGTNETISWVLNKEK